MVKKTAHSNSSLNTADKKLQTADEYHLSPQRLVENKNTSKSPWKTILFLFLVVLAIGGVNMFDRSGISEWLSTGINGKNNPKTNQIAKSTLPKAEVKPFTSKEDMLAYLQKANTQSSISWSGAARTMALPANGSMAVDAPQAMMKSDSMAGIVAQESRVSDTNVQVAGIDEPDIVKTDGKQIYFSSEQAMIRPLIKRMAPSIGVGSNIMPPQPLRYGSTQIISAFPPEQLKQTSQIDTSGNLLIDGNVLIVLGNDNKVYGYDVTDPNNPKSKWNFELSENNTIYTARQAQGKLFLITRTYINHTNPCPYQPLKSEASVVIPCTSMYHPVPLVTVDSTYTAMVVNPQTGSVEKTAAFVGSTNNSTVYMSEGNLYLTYSYSGDFVSYLTNFFTTDGKDLLPQQYVDRLIKLQNYDISASAKMAELNVIYSEYQQSLSNDDQMKFGNDLNNRMEGYTKAHLRELEKTGIVKIDTTSLKITANGEVPGHPLNQFALDEYKNNLRIATTTSNNFWGFGINSSQSVNDVTVLNSDLKSQGSVQNLGLSERIYSVRFIQDKAYLVTFKQTDPFYVLDLSNPGNPQLKGELKIPGYSSYLHPLADNVILGVGMEEGKVKLSLFDVKDATNPIQISKYSVDEYWTEISNNHHAFLQDEKHQVFFMPGGKGGYVFSYANNDLKLQKTVSDNQIKRALYINDYLYMIGENKILVLNEKDWTEVNHLSLDIQNPEIEKPISIENSPELNLATKTMLAEPLPASVTPQTVE